MQQAITESYSYNQYAGFNPITGTMREISESEIDQVSGGIAPFIIAGAKLAGGAFVGGFMGAAGTWAFKSLLPNGDDACS